MDVESYGQETDLVWSITFRVKTNCEMSSGTFDYLISIVNDEDDTNLIERALNWITRDSSELVLDSKETLPVGYTIDNVVVKSGSISCQQIT